MIIPDNVKIKDIPIEIKSLIAYCQCNIPIGFEYYEELIDKYPEYFTDILEWRDKLSKVPQEVHDVYNKDIDEKFNYKGKHLGNGIMYCINHQKEVDEEFELSDKIHGTYDEIWNKHYSKYGLKKDANTK